MIYSVSAHLSTSRTTALEYRDRPPAIDRVLQPARRLQPDLPPLEPQPPPDEEPEPEERLEPVLPPEQEPVPA